MPNAKNLIPATTGEVRNPNGRPVGSKNRATMYKQWLDIKAKFKIPDSEEETEGTVLDKIVVAQINKAANGDTAAFREIMDGVFGKIKDESDVFIEGEIKVSNVIDMSKWK